MLPGVLVVFLGFDAGGFFAGTTGLTAAVLAGLAALRLLSAERSQFAITRLAGVALAGLGVYAGWSWLSAAWSHAPARGLLAFDRGVLYLLVVVMFGVAQSRPRTLIRGLASGAAIVCGAGLLSRVLPHVLATDSGFQNQRLSYPVTYWNALGLLAALGIICCVHLAADPDEPRVGRALWSALVPALGATLLLTFSRGSIVAVGVMLVLYAILGLGLRSLIPAVLIGVPTAIAVRVTYGADQLAGRDPTGPVAVAQGHHVAIVVGACALAAGALSMLAPVGLRGLGSVHLPRPARLGAALAAVVIAVGLGIAAGGPGWLSREYHGFVRGNVVLSGPQSRSRLSASGNNGRLRLWSVALDGFRSAPLHGQGAGTYALLWQRERPAPEPVQNAHSLYLETLDELGVVGLAALVAGLIALLAGAAGGLVSPPDRTRSALAVAAMLGWALEAGVDWDWQMPVVTAPVLALATAAGVRRRGHDRRPERGGATASAGRFAIAGRGALVARVAAAAGCLALGVAPALVAVSQASLDDSVVAFDNHLCAAATADARSAISAVSSRPEPYEILGYCDARGGRWRPAAQAMTQAITLDPGDWTYHYGLALVLAEGRRDPRPQLRIARRLDPQEHLLFNAGSAFRRSRGRGAAWRRAAIATGFGLQ